MLSSHLIHLVSIIGTLNLAFILSESAPVGSESSKPATLPKLKRDSRAKVTSLELDTQETGYLPPAYQTADSGYGYDAGKNTYGKQASDWSLYDQGEICIIVLE